MTKIEKFYGTAWCKDCKQAKAFLAKHRIEYDYIDIDYDEESSEIVKKLNKGKRKVPTITFDDGSFLVEPSDAELAEKLGLIPKIEKEGYDLIIIGGGPAALTCAIYTSREGMSTLVLEKGSFGGQMGFTNKIDNYPGFPEGITGKELAEKFFLHAKRFGAELVNAIEVQNVTKLEDGFFETTTSTGFKIKSKAVVIATGTTYRSLGVPGEEILLGYKIHFCATCDGPFYKGKHILVIGGGNSAFEESMFLAKFAEKVTIIEIMDHFNASKIIQDKALSNPKIEAFTSYETKEFVVGERKTLESVVCFDRANNKEVILKPDAVFEYVGLKPNIEPVKDIVELDKNGFIKTDEHFMTSVKGLFATGDCRGGSIQQVTAATGEGTAVALHIREFLNL
ncbi:MAG: FAD-dependent oxidoreductase [Candidatus Heimdallarchaeum endolithica]|uniref:FAD-dependent oxidoreductase n=1 Tax=Candidatus Heimdallarchaeum endolithica TaxID=2876572 RepID=A0A9Y1BSP9_9ARCH|nr:MAG: FAD-dependent oxidoreductase [Candidatus Heimdallarchaeum endolithica]